MKKTSNICIIYLSFIHLGWDFLYYGEGTEVGQYQLEVFSGLELPKPFKVVNSSMWFRFTSSYANEDKGFEFSWNVTSKLRFL